MKIYLAAAWSRRLEMADVANQIRDFYSPYAEVYSRWLVEGSDADLRTRASEDLQDIDDCDVLIRFTDHPTLIAFQDWDGVPTGYAPAHLITGARMVEMGYAMAKGKTIVVVGGHQAIFDHLSIVHHVENVEGLLDWIAREIAYSGVRGLDERDRKV